MKKSEGFTCCFWGHRQIEETEEMRNQVRDLIEMLILEENVDTFLFGSKSQFNSLCYELVTKAKERYPHIRRVYVRAEFPVISDSYRSYLINNYEDTYYPEKIIGAGKAVYVKRNYEMIDCSEFCVVHYRTDYMPVKRKSGTKLAVNYAVKKQKRIYYV